MYFSQKVSRSLRKKVSPKKHPLLFSSIVIVFLFFLLVSSFFVFQTSKKDIHPEKIAFSSEINIASSSPLGAMGGLVIPASCPSNSHDPEYGTNCQSAPNACNMTNSGTIQCGGECSASTPLNSSCPPECDTTHNNCKFGSSTTKHNSVGYQTPHEDTTKYYWTCGKDTYTDAWEWDADYCSEAKSQSTPTIDVHF